MHSSDENFQPLDADLTTEQGSKNPQAELKQKSSWIENIVLHR